MLTNVTDDRGYLLANIEEYEVRSDHALIWMRAGGEPLGGPAAPTGMLGEVTIKHGSMVWRGPATAVFI